MGPEKIALTRAVKPHCDDCYSPLPFFPWSGTPRDRPGRGAAGTPGSDWVIARHGDH